MTVAAGVYTLVAVCVSRRRMTERKKSFSGAAFFPDQPLGSFPTPIPAVVFAVCVFGRAFQRLVVGLPGKVFYE